MSEYRTARIFVRDKLAGILRETDEGYSFVYDTDYFEYSAPVEHLRRLKLNSVVGVN